MSRKHKLFFALVPDPSVIRQVASLQQSLGVSGRAVKPQQFHVTLSFLGMQNSALIPEILGIASQLRFEPGQLILDRLGSFRRAGVLWLGASEVPAGLQEARNSLVNALLDAGIGHDLKAWKFHLTLYRKMRKPPPIMDPVAIEWSLNGFSLIESVGVKNGVEYHTVGQWKAGF